MGDGEEDQVKKGKQIRKCLPGAKFVLQTLQINIKNA